MTVQQRLEDSEPAHMSAAPLAKGGTQAAGAALASPPQATCGPPASAFASRFSQEGRDRQQGTLRKLASTFMGVPGVVSLSGGFPPTELFPFESLSITLRNAGGRTITIDDPGKVATAQQYNLALRGYAPLVRWVEEHTAAVHRPPGPHESAITNGGNHTVEMLVSLLLDRGDSFLAEEYTYPHMLECVAAPKGLHVLPLPMDAQGIIPEAMEQLLERLRTQPAGAPGAVPFPKLLYTIPTAQNPTGATITPARRAAVYDLCSRYDILIIEDDPYFYLQFPTAPGSGAGSPVAPASPSGSESSSAAGSDYMLASLSDGSASSASGGLAPAVSGALTPTCSTAMSLAGSVLPLPVALTGAGGGSSDTHRWLGGVLLGGGPASYLSLDVDGRVARVDSFAKFLSPGLRLGWVTAPPDLLAKLVMCLQAHTVGPCSLSQVMVAETLAAWGEEGLQAHLRRVQEAYAARAMVMVEAAEQELTGLAEWVRPSGGMFLWMRLLGVGDATEVWAELQRHKLVVLPGRVMHPRSSDPAFKSPFVRISYSHAPEDQIREGMRRLGQVLRTHAAAADAGAGGHANGNSCGGWSG